MLKKIGIFLCSLILIPTIAYAKLNKMEFISETSIPGERINLKDTNIYIQKDKLVFTDRAGNILQEEPYDKRFEIEYIYQWDKLVLHDDKTGEIIVKDKNYKTLAKNNLIPDITDKHYDDEYLYVSKYVNGFRNSYIYDKNLKLIVKLDDDYAYQPKVFNDKVVSVAYKYPYISHNPPIQKSEHTVKVYDRKGKLLKTQVFTSPEELYNHIELTTNGNFLLLSDSKKSITLYNSLTMQSLKEIKNIERVEVIGDKIYLFNVGTNDLIENANEDKEKLAKIKIPMYNEKLELIGEATYNEYKDDYYHPSNYQEYGVPYEVQEEIEEKVKQKFEEFVNFRNIIEYRNEYYTILHTTSSDNTYLYHTSKDLKEEEYILLNEKELPTGYILDPIYVITDNNDIVVSSIIRIPQTPCLLNPENGELPTEKEPYPDEYLDTFIYHRFKIIGEPYNITTNIKGKGTIEVPKSSQPNEMVNLNVKPAEGYTIANLYIVDNKGKKTKLTKDNFKMPEGNVTVEVEFTVINPETITHNTYFIIASISLLTILILLLITKKVNKYEN